MNTVCFFFVVVIEAIFQMKRVLKSLTISWSNTKRKGSFYLMALNDGIATK